MLDIEGNDAIKKFIRDHCDETFSNNGVPCIEITKAQEELKINFGGKLKDFYENIGYLSFRENKFCGLGLPEKHYLNAITATKEKRGIGLPKDFVVVELLDEYCYVCDLEDNVFIYNYLEGFTDMKQNLDDFILCKLMNL